MRACYLNGRNWFAIIANGSRKRKQFVVHSLLFVKNLNNKILDRRKKEEEKYYYNKYNKKVFVYC
jgi:hypothetical protein